MPIAAPRPASIAGLFAAWRALPAFRAAPWGRVRLFVRRRRPGGPAMDAATGEARLIAPGEWRIVVRVGYSAADARMTLLHEMAHIATWAERAIHGPKWRAAYAAACAQACGAYPLRGAREDLDPAVRELLR